MERMKQDSPAISRIVSLAACNLRYTKIEGYENEIPKWVMIKLVAEIRSFAAFPHLPNQLVTVIDEQSLRAIGNRCKGIRRKPEGRETAENAPYCAEDDDSTNKFLAYYDVTQLRPLADLLEHAFGLKPLTTRMIATDQQVNRGIQELWLQICITEAKHLKYVNAGITFVPRPSPRRLRTLDHTQTSHHAHTLTRQHH